MSAKSAVSARSTCAEVPRSLTHNISWSFLGLAGYAAAQWGMLVVLAQLTSPEVVGQFTLSLAITGPLMLFAGLDLRLVQAADANRRFAFSDYFSLRLISAIVTLLAIAVTCFLLGVDSSVLSIIILMGLLKAIELQSDVFHGLFQQRERMDLMARSTLGRGVLSLALFALAIALTRSLALGVSALAVSGMTMLLCYDVPNAPRFLPGGLSELFRANVSPRHLVLLFGAALPAGLRALLLSLESALPQFFLQYFHGEVAVGKYAALAYSLVVVLTFTRSMNQPAVPRLAMLFAQGNSTAFYALLRRLCFLGAIVGVSGLAAVAIAGKSFLAIAYGSSYADQFPVLVILTAACAIRVLSLPVAAGLAAANSFAMTLYIQIIAIVLLTAASVALVPAYGLHGAAYAMVLVSVAMLFVHVMAAGGVFHRAFRPVEDVNANSLFRPAA